MVPSTKGVADESEFPPVAAAYHCMAVPVTESEASVPDPQMVCAAFPVGVWIFDKPLIRATQFMVWLAYLVNSPEMM